MVKFVQTSATRFRGGVGPVFASFFFMYSAMALTPHPFSGSAGPFSRFSSAA
jgi:hypothetical protein